MNKRRDANRETRKMKRQEEEIESEGEEERE